MKGFTLIELLIVITIIGILGAMAYSSYGKSLAKGRRANAKALAMDISQREQQYLLDNRAYTAAITSCTANTASVTSTFPGMTGPADVAKYYTCAVTTSAGPPPTFTVTLTPYGTHLSDETASHQTNNGRLTIDNTGAKTGPW